MQICFFCSGLHFLHMTVICARELRCISSEAFLKPQSTFHPDLRNCDHLPVITTANWHRKWYIFKRCSVDGVVSVYETLLSNLTLFPFLLVVSFQGNLLSSVSNHRICIIKPQKQFKASVLLNNNWVCLGSGSLPDGHQTKTIKTLSCLYH